MGQGGWADDKAPLRAMFRCDASLEIGLGHVMRCLTLAQELRARGHICHFICRDLSGHMGPRILADGFGLSLLPAPDAPFVPALGLPAHAHWAGVCWETDAAQTAQAMPACDWLIMDHYAFDARWQRAVLPQGAKLAVLDDLADRPHIADLLLDQNLGRQARDYDGLVPPHCERLIGPRYALLRPEFAAARPAALAARAQRHYELRHILISMGGVDAPNATAQALDGVQRFTRAFGHPLKVTVVLGPHAPALPQVQAQAALMDDCRVLVDVKDMAPILAQCDLAIGAAGGSAWERCCLGLPTLIVVLADNQKGAAIALEAVGAGVNLGDCAASDFGRKLDRALGAFSAQARLALMSKAAETIADGQGSAYFGAALRSPLLLRKATLEDAALVWDWRSSLPDTHFLASEKPTLSGHIHWFKSAIAAPERRLLMVTVAQAAPSVPIAHLRLDLQPDKPEAEVSILLANSARGKGYGGRLLSMLADYARSESLSALTAKVANGNTASMALFQSAGYKKVAVESGFAHFRYGV